MVPSFYGNTVYFIEVDPITYKTSIYRVAQPGAEPTLVAATGDTGPSGTYQLFSTLSAHAGGLVFEAYIQSGANYNEDLFNYDGNTVSAGLLGRLSTPLPGRTNYLFWNESPLQPQVRDGDVFFIGNGYYFGNIQGLYALPLPGSSSQPRVIVDTLIDVPGLTPGPGSKFRLPDLANFSNFAFDVDGERTVFLARAAGSATTAHGIYEWDTSGLRVAIDGSTPRPGTTDTFVFTDETYYGATMAVSGTKIAFCATDTNFVHGIFVKDGASLEEIAVDGTQVAGFELFNPRLTRNGFKGNQLIFSSRSVLWRATLGAAPTPVSLTIQRTANATALSWDAQVAGASAVLEETDSLATPNWQPVQNQSNPYPVPNTSPVRYFRLRQ